MSKLDFLKDDDTTAPAPEPAAPQAPPPPDASPPPPVEPASRSEPSTVPPGYIPLAAQLDERDKRQRIERDFEDLKRKYEDATKAPPQTFDPISDPEGYDRSINERLQATEWKLITKVSHQYAVRQHGADKVKAAEDWLAKEMETNPAMFQVIQRQDDPYDFVVRQHKRSLNMSKIGDDEPETFAEKWAAANGYVKADQQLAAAPTGGAPPPQSTPTPKASLASAPSAGGSTPKMPVGPGVAFREAFRK